MKQRKVSEVPRGKSKIKNAHERWTGLTTQENINNKNWINLSAHVK
jgi:hypothetical protein